MLNQEDKKIRVDINHIPVMITDKGKLLCIASEKETFHIGVSAMTGKGKGILGNTILGFEYCMNKRPCLILNDFQQETFEMSLPCQNKIFLNNLKIINARPTGLPIVYVYPSNKDLIIGEVERKFPHIKMSIHTRSIITQIDKYYDLGKSTKYFTANIEKFMECKDLEEVEEALKEIIEENVQEYKNRKSLENMMFKIKTVFKNIFDEMITDNSSPDAPAQLRVKSNQLGEYSNFTIQCLIALGFIPSIQTCEIRSKPWFAAYMSFIVSSLYEDKRKDSFFKDKPILMYVPEIDKMWKGDNGDLIKKELALIGTNGRRSGIGMIWDCQDYDSVPDAIRSNTPYMFVLRKANAEEVRGIQKDFHISNEVKDQILSLETNPQKGIFECVALTARDPGFVLYNLRNGKIERTNSPQKGRLITPLSNHKIPGVPLGDII
jgi:hypothetical protein